MKTPFISVVIPTYNSEEYIAETLSTVFSQVYEDYEVIVSDDGSMDNTMEIVKTIFNECPEKRTKLLTNNHEGPGATRNRGINAASGKWISFLDSDDRWLPGKLKTIFDYISLNNGVDLVCHNEIWRDGENEIQLKYREMFNEHVAPFLSLYRKNALSTSAVSVKKELLIDAGLFDSSLPAAQDYDLWLRLALLDNIKIAFIEQPLGLYITREGNISSRPEKRLHCLLQISRKYFKELKRLTPFPVIERRKFEGRVYGSAGFDLIGMKNYKKGVYFLITSIIKWPFRFDWVSKFLISNRF